MGIFGEKRKSAYFLFTVHRNVCSVGQDGFTTALCVNTHDGKCSGWKYLSECSDTASDISANRIFGHRPRYFSSPHVVLLPHVTSVVTLLVSV